MGVVRVKGWVGEDDVKWMRIVTKTFKEVVEKRERKRGAMRAASVTSTRSGGGGSGGEGSPFMFDHTRSQSQESMEGSTVINQSMSTNKPRSESIDESGGACLISCIAYSTGGTLLLNYLIRYQVRRERNEPTSTHHLI